MVNALRPIAVLTVALAAVLALVVFEHRAEADEDRSAKAKAEFDTASKYFEAEEYEAALPHFRNAYDLSNHRPASIFALAQCERALKRYDEAINHFNEYLATRPSDASQVKETVKLLEELRDNAKRLEQSKRATGEETPDLDAAPEKPGSRPPKKQPEPDRSNTPPIDAPRTKPVLKPLEIAPDQQAEKAAEKPAEKPVEKPADKPVEKPAEKPVELAAKSPPPEEHRAVTAAPGEQASILESPILWIGAGAAVILGAVAIGFLARSKESPYGGSSGVVIDPH